MKLAQLVQVSTAVASTSGKLDKIAKLAAFLAQLAPDEIPIAIGFFTGWPRQGRIGVGWASVSSARGSEAVAAPALDLHDVDRVFSELQAVRGKRSGAERGRLMAELFARSTTDEQQFLSALIVGDVRQGALEGVLAEAVARAAGIPGDRVRRAAMMAGDLGVVAGALMAEGESVLARYQLELFRPIQPMLADSAATVSDALTQYTPALLEWKLDGVRIHSPLKDCSLPRASRCTPAI